MAAYKSAWIKENSIGEEEMEGRRVTREERRAIDNHNLFCQLLTEKLLTAVQVKRVKKQLLTEPAELAKSNWTDKYGFPNHNQSSGL